MPPLEQADFSADLGDSTIDLICFNLRSIKPNIPYLKFLCNKYKAILCLSEHWLHTFQSSVLSTIHNEYQYTVECVPDCEHAVYCFPRLLRGHGGVAILWHNSLRHVVSPVNNPRNDRLVGLRLKCFPCDIIILSVYLPTRSASTEPFREMLDIIDSAFILFPNCVILPMGDFNADIGSTSRSPNEQGSILLRYMERWNYVSSHLQLQRDGALHTFESEAHKSLSTIDHILCPASFLVRMVSSRVLINHPLNMSDHLPIHASLSLSLLLSPACI